MKFKLLVVIVLSLMCLSCKTEADKMSELKELQSLRDTGALTNEEFTKEKEALLNSSYSNWYEWVFSGIGTALLGLGAGYSYVRKSNNFSNKSNNNNKNTNSNNVYQNGGDNSNQTVASQVNNYK